MNTTMLAVAHNITTNEVITIEFRRGATLKMSICMTSRGRSLNQSMPYLGARVGSHARTSQMTEYISSLTGSTMPNGRGANRSNSVCSTWGVMNPLAASATAVRRSR